MRNPKQNSDDVKVRANSIFFEKPDKGYFDEFVLQDIDEAMLNWFQDLDLKIIREGGKQEDVDIVFITAERWEKAEKEKGILDSKRRIKFPIVSIFRSRFIPNISRRVEQYDATNTRVKEEVIKVMSQDYRRDYTNPSTRKNIRKPIYRIISIPYPTFFNLQYEIKIQTNFVTHANQLLQQIFNDNLFIWVKSKKGYGFHASLGEPTSSELVDQATTERIIKHNFTVTAQAYLIEKETINRARENIIISETKAELDIQENINTSGYNPPLGKKPTHVLAQ